MGGPTIAELCHNWRDIDWFVSAQNTRGGARYTWNAENRLIAVEPISHLGGVPRVEFAYDYQGRRVAKRVYDWDPGDPNDPNDDDWASTPSTSRAFVWSGWLKLLELDVDPNDANDPSTRRAYTWGLDLAGQQGSVNSLDAAGGIGGLLAISDPNDPNDPNDLFGDFAYTYDANGNVGQLIDWAHDPNDPNGAIVARYEYDPYGKVIGPDDDDDGDWRDDAGPYATENPIRFSTKYFDDETGLGAWIYRYYSPSLGRWISRDPIEELGAVSIRGLFSRVASVAPDSADRQTVRAPSTSDMNSYTYLAGNLSRSVDPFGLCEESITFRGHGLFEEDPTKNTIRKGETIPVCMTNGIRSDACLTKWDVEKHCKDLCCDATLVLRGCGIGHNEEYMRELASRCPRITRVCGTLPAVKYIPYTNITIPVCPWNWNCIDVEDAK